MLTLTRWYESRAKNCVQAAGRTDNLRHRDHLLNLAYEWAQAAERAALVHIAAQRNSAVISRSDLLRPRANWRWRDAMCVTVGNKLLDNARS
jgi:hypothetical protein